MDDEETVRTYREALPPRWQAAFDQMVTARQGRDVACRTFDPDETYAPRDIYIGGAEAFPDSSVAYVNRDKFCPPDGHKKYQCFRHLADFKAAVGPKFPWYDVDRPDVAGFVCAGSICTPCFHAVEQPIVIDTADFDENRKCVQGTVHMHMPENRGDVDLFMVGGNAQNAETLVRRALEGGSELNPLARLDGIVECRECYKHVLLTNAWPLGFESGFECLDCMRNTAARPLHVYAAKHVIGFQFRGLKIQIVTRLYASPMKVPSLFDLTYDGGVFDGKTVRFLDISLHQQSTGVLLVTPFSGSTTQEARMAKKLIGYGLDLLVPGCTVSSIDRVNSSRGLVPLLNILLYAREVMPLLKGRTNALAALDAVARMREPFLLKAMFRMLIGLRVSTLGGAARALTSAGRDRYSFVPGCTGVRISRGPILLVDIPGSPLHVGAFSFRSPAEFSRDMCMLQDECTGVENSVAVRAALSPIAYTGNCQSKMKKVARLFTPYIASILTSYDTDAVDGAEAICLGRPLYAEGVQSKELIVVVLFKLLGTQGAQTWKLDFTVKGSPPVATCTEDTLLFSTGQAVCMGALTHFHAEEERRFSLASFVNSVVQLPVKIMDKDVEYIHSIGVLETPGSMLEIVRLHEKGLESASKRQWDVKISTRPGWAEVL